MTNQTANEGPAIEPWPRVTIVTPITKHNQHLEATIRSVVLQCYPNLEYIVMDDESREVGEVLRKYEQRLSRFACSCATGVGDALNSIFAKSSGEIMGWLEPGDMLHTNGLFVIGSVFSAFPEVEWITGRPFNFSPSGLPTGMKHLERWSRIRFLAGGNKYIHRDTTFWRRSLWDRAGGALDSTCGAAAEFELFLRFFRTARLYSVDALIGGYRTHPGNHAIDGSHRPYNRLCDEIADRELARVSGAYAAKLFRGLNRVVAHVPKLRSWWHKYAIRCVYRCPGPDWPARIVAHGDRWLLRK